MARETDALSLLTGFERELLEHLPAAPNGLSLYELADGILGSRGPRARHEILVALMRLDRYLGGLARTAGDDDFDHAAVTLWGLPPETWRVVRRLAARGPGTALPARA